MITVEITLLLLEKNPGYAHVCIVYEERILGVKEGLKDTKYLLLRISESAEKFLSPINNFVFSGNGNVDIMRIQQHSYFLPDE